MRKEMIKLSNMDKMMMPKVDNIMIEKNIIDDDENGGKDDAKAEDNDDINAEDDAKYDAVKRDNDAEDDSKRRDEDAPIYVDEADFQDEDDDAQT
jgi:hypothetical protein